MRHKLIIGADNCLWSGKAGMGHIRLPDMRLQVLQLLQNNEVSMSLVGHNFNEVLVNALKYLGIQEYFDLVLGDPIPSYADLAMRILDATVVHPGFTVKDQKEAGSSGLLGYSDAVVVIPSEPDRVKLRDSCKGLIVGAPDELDFVISRHMTPTPMKLVRKDKKI